MPAPIGEEQVTFRAPPELTAAIDREVELRASARPGERITRSVVLRSMLYEMLLPQEPKRAATKKPKRVVTKKRATKRTPARKR